MKIISREYSAQLFGFSLLIFLTSSGIFANPEQKEMDALLQEELRETKEIRGGNLESGDGSGQESGSDQKSSNPADPQLKQGSSTNGSGPGAGSRKGDGEFGESNPVLERYGDREESESTVWILLKLILIFGALIFIMLYVLKVLSRTQKARYPVQGLMEVLSNLSIAQGKNLQLVRVGEKYLVLGVADHSIQLITEIQSPEELNSIRKAREEFEPSQENFLVTLLESLKDFSPKISKTSETSREFLLSDDEELKKLEKDNEALRERFRQRKKDLGIDPNFSGGSA
jgi:flagellar protein FliO/FliZ